MAVFALNQPVSTTVPNVSVDNKFTVGQYTFQLVVQNNSGVQSDAVTMIVVVSAAAPPLTGMMGSPLTRVAKAPAKPATQPQPTDQAVKSQPAKTAPTEVKPVKDKTPKTPAKKRPRKKPS